MSLWTLEKRLDGGAVLVLFSCTLVDNLDGGEGRRTVGDWGLGKMGSWKGSQVGETVH